SQYQYQNQLPLTFNTHPQPQTQYSPYQAPPESAQVPYSISPPEHAYQPLPVVADSVVQSTFEASPMPSERSGNQLSLNNTNSSSPQASIALTNSESSNPPVVHGPQLYPQNEFQ
ncbi:hypothetical protein BGZ76_004938, partial [Entomortierella beljakovae]